MMRMLPYLCGLCTYLLLPATVLAQGWSLGAEVAYGAPLGWEGSFTSGNNLAGRPLRFYRSVGLAVSREPATYQPWRERYGYPRAAISLRYLSFDSPGELGSPVALLRTFRGPFRRGRTFDFEYVAGVGLSYGWRRYDYFANPLNNLMSTRTNAYVQIGVGLGWRLSSTWRLTADAALHHFSNGNLRRPNLGINAIALDLAVRYRLPAAERPPPDVHLRLEPFRRRTQLTLTLYGGREHKLYYPGGLAEAERNRGLSHPVAGVSLSADRRLTPKAGVGLGVNLIHRTTGPVDVGTHDGSLVVLEPALRPENVRVGLFPIYEQYFGRVSVTVQAEYYVYLGEDTDFLGRSSQQLGFRYRLGRHSFVGVAVNARQLTIADFIEWRVGHRFSASR